MYSGQDLSFWTVKEIQQYWNKILRNSSLLPCNQLKWRIRQILFAIGLYSPLHTHLHVQNLVPQLHSFSHQTVDIKNIFHSVDQKANAKRPYTSSKDLVPIEA